MKRIATVILGAALVPSLASRSTLGLPGKQSASPAPSESGMMEIKTSTITGTINRMDDYLVLLLDNGDYQIFDFDKGLDASTFAEGDKVEVTYTGVLGDENATPVATKLVKQ